jgi:hypothetical protein
MKAKASIIAMTIAASGLAFAVNAAGAPLSALPATQKQGEISYLSGGIGQTEANAIKRVAKRYPLELEFVRKAKPKDEYLADVKVNIKDAHDKVVLDTTADGPFLLAQMPAGKYTISADRDGKVEHRRIEIAAKEHQRLVFAWKS